MRRNTIDNVEIVEPPIGELTKKHSSLRGACLTGCGTLVVLGIGLIVAFKLFVGTGPTTIKTVPANFPGGIPLYDKDNIDKITFISGQYKNRSLEVAALFPKVILSSLIINTQSDEKKSSAKTPANDSFTGRLWELVTTPVGDSRDTVQIEWRGMDADPFFVASYYKKELRKQDYLISEENAIENSYQFSFTRATTVGGVFKVMGNSGNKPGTSFAVLTVNFSSTSTKN